MHCEKFKLSQVSAMIGHYLRSWEEAHIDSSKTHLNDYIYTNALFSSCNGERDLIVNNIRFAIENSATRLKKGKNENVAMFDWITTLPKEVKPEDEKRFFELVHQFLEYRYNADNVIGSFIHRDEVTPHMHTSIIPFKDNKLNAKAILTKYELAACQKDCNEYVSSILGYNVHIRNDVSLNEAGLQHLDPKELKRQRAKRNQELYDTLMSRIQNRSFWQRVLDKKPKSIKLSWEEMQFVVNNLKENRDYINIFPQALMQALKDNTAKNDRAYKSFVEIEQQIKQEQAQLQIGKHPLQVENNNLQNENIELKNKLSEKENKLKYYEEHYDLVCDKLQETADTLKKTNEDFDFFKKALEECNKKLSNINFQQMFLEFLRKIKEKSKLNNRDYDSLYR